MGKVVTVPAMHGVVLNISEWAIFMGHDPTRHAGVCEIGGIVWFAFIPPLRDMGVGPPCLEQVEIVQGHATKAIGTRLGHLADRLVVDGYQIGVRCTGWGYTAPRFIDQIIAVS